MRPHVDLPDAEASDDDWQRIWEINVRAHIYAARAVLPAMLERGEGYLLQTASAAGLLTQIGSAPYAVTKHAAVALAEWLAMTHGDAGIKVSCLCPQGVRTRMLMGEDMSSTANFLMEGSVSPEEVAEAVVKGLDEERFLILPHPEVAEYFRRKADDYDRWLRGMRRLQSRVNAANVVVVFASSAPRSTDALPMSTPTPGFARLTAMRPTTSASVVTTSK